MCWHGSEYISFKNQTRKYLQTFSHNGMCWSPKLRRRLLLASVVSCPSPSHARGRERERCDRSVAIAFCTRPGCVILQQLGRHTGLTHHGQQKHSGSQLQVHAKPGEGANASPGSPRISFPVCKMCLSRAFSLSSPLTETKSPQSMPCESIVKSPFFPGDPPPVRAPAKPAAPFLGSVGLFRPL